MRWIGSAPNAFCTVVIPVEPSVIVFMFYNLLFFALDPNMLHTIKQTLCCYFTARQGICQRVRAITRKPSLIVQGRKYMVLLLLFYKSKALKE